MEQTAQRQHLTSQFRIGGDIEPIAAQFGSFRWLSHPPSTGASQLTVMEATLLPGEAHSFHKHPDQEEVVYVVSGRVEQWLEREKRILVAGDAAFIPAGLVHASFNAGEDDARLVVVFGPCVGEGFVSVEVADEAPWNGLRTRTN